MVAELAAPCTRCALVEASQKNPASVHSFANDWASDSDPSSAALAEAWTFVEAVPAKQLPVDAAAAGGVA